MSLAAASDAFVRESLVRVVLKRQTSGLLHDGRLISQAQVLEVSELNGIMLDGRGYVVAYIGHHSEKLGAPGVRFEVERSDGNLVEAGLVGVDERISLAVLQSPEAGRHPAVLGGTVAEGELQFFSLANDGWDASTLKVVRHSADELLPEGNLRICPLNSRKKRSAADGSLIFDQYDRFVGIVTFTGKSLFSKDVDLFRFLPVSRIRRSLRRIIKEEGDIKSGWLGIFLDDKATGVRVKNVIPGSPAEKAGLSPGDRITKMNGSELEGPGDLARAIRWSGADSRVRLTIDRDGQFEPAVVEAKLTERPLSQKPRMAWALQVPRVWDGREQTNREVRFYPVVLPSAMDLGFVTETVTPQLARYFRCPKNSGLLVKSVLEGSPAERFGFRAGDVLFKINGEDLMSPTDLQEALRDSGGALDIHFIRDGEVLVQSMVFN